MRAAAALAPAPDALIVTGDLVDEPGAREYERVRELLAPLRMPVFVIAGNHDDRDALREYFALAGAATGAAGAAGAPFQYSVAIGNLRLVVCDTTVPGEDGGSLDAQRRAWLATELAAAPATPMIVAMHHPPVATSFPAFDEIGVPEADRLALGELLAANPQVVRVICGHVHRAFFDTLAGCGVVVCPSTWLQAPLEIGMREIELVREPPAYAVHASVDGGLVSHIEPLGPV